MAEVTVRIDDVERYDGTSKKNGKPYTKFSVKAGGRRYDTFRREIVEPAGALKGQMATLVYTETQNGEYTNYDLEGVKAAPQEATIATERPTPDPFDTQVVSNVPGVRTAPTASDKDVSIARAVALKAAVETATGLQLVDADSNQILGIAEFYAAWLLDTHRPASVNPFADLAMASSDAPVDGAELVKF